MQVYLRRNEDGTIRAEKVHVETWDQRRFGIEKDGSFLEEVNSEYERGEVKEYESAKTVAAQIVPKYYAPVWLFVFPPLEDKLKAKKPKS